MTKQTESHKLRLLIVDDEPDLREVIILVLASCLRGEFIEAGTGKEAIGILETQALDINFIVSDFNMPNGTGATLARYLTDKKLEIPFLLLSSDDREKHEDILQGSHRAYLQKPFNNKDLRSILETFVKNIKGLELSEQEYVPVSLSTLQRLTTITRPLYILLGDSKFIKVIHPGGSFTFEVEERFTKKNITHLYVHKDDMAPLLNEFRENVFTEMYFHSLKERSTEALKLSKSTVELVQIAAKSLNWSPEIVAMGNDNIRLIQNIVKCTPDINNVFDWFSSEEHNLGVSTGILLSYFIVALTKEMQISNEREIEYLTLAGFFHDMMLDDFLIKNQDQFINALNMGSALNKEKVEMVRHHPMEACEVLSKWDLCPKEVLLLIEQHHEFPDGSGFPKKLKGEQLLPLSGVFIVACAVVEIFIRTKDKFAVKEYLQKRESIFMLEPTRSAYQAAIQML